MNVLTISLGRNILKQGSRERARMLSYAVHLTEFHIIVLTRKEHGFGEVMHQKNLHMYPTHSSSRVWMLFDAFRIGRKIIQKKRAEPLVISAQDPLEIGWLCWLMSFFKNTRLHIQVHGDYFSSNAWVGGSPARRIRRFFAMVLLKRVSAIRVVSKRIAQSLIAHGIKEERITTLPIRPELESFLHVTHSLHTAPPYRFLYAGRLALEKGIMRILESFNELQKTRSDIELRIVGDGEEKKKIIFYVQTHKLTNKISLAPWTENVPNEMSKADVFLLASEHEAYALTLVEALAVGVPLITTDVGCVGEVILDNVHGIVVREEGVGPYKNAMEKMIVDNSFRESCGRNGKETAKILTAHSPDTYAQGWVTAVARALKQV